MKRNSFNGLAGRMVVLTKTKDKCESEKEFDEIADIYATGLLSVFKTQAITNNANGKEDYLIREINSIDKEKFDRSIGKENVKSKPVTVKRLMALEKKKPDDKEERRDTKTEEVPKKIMNLNDLLNMDPKPTPVPVQERKKKLFNADDLDIPTFKPKRPVSRKSLDDDDDFISPRVKTSTPKHLLSDDEVYPKLKKEKPISSNYFKSSRKKTAPYYSPKSNDDESDEDKRFKMVTDNLLKSEKAIEEKEKSDTKRPTHNSDSFYPSHKSVPNSPYSNSFLPSHHKTYQTYHPYRPTIIPTILTEGLLF